MDKNRVAETIVNNFKNKEFIMLFMTQQYKYIFKSISSLPSSFKSH